MGQEEETKLNNIYQILIFALLCLATKEEELMYSDRKIQYSVFLYSSMVFEVR